MPLAMFSKIKGSIWTPDRSGEEPWTVWKSVRERGESESIELSLLKVRSRRTDRNEVNERVECDTAGELSWVIDRLIISSCTILEETGEDDSRPSARAPRFRDVNRRIEIDERSPNQASNPMNTIKITTNPTSNPIIVDEPQESWIPPRYRHLQSWATNTKRKVRESRTCKASSRQTVELRSKTAPPQSILINLSLTVYCWGIRGGSQKRKMAASTKGVGMRQIQKHHLEYA